MRRWLQGKPAHAQHHLPSNTLIMRADGPQVAAVAENVIHIR